MSTYLLTPVKTFYVHDVEGTLLLQPRLSTSYSSTMNPCPYLLVSFLCLVAQVFWAPLLIVWPPWIPPELTVSVSLSVNRQHTKGTDDKGESEVTGKKVFVMGFKGNPLVTEWAGVGRVTPTDVPTHNSGSRSVSSVKWVGAVRVTNQAHTSTLWVFPVTPSLGSVDDVDNLFCLT